MYDWLLYGGLGVLAKCLWDFLWDTLDRRQDRKYAARDTAQPQLIGSLADESPESSSAPAPMLELIRTKRCPEGYSAKQILRYGRGDGRWVEPQFPGGLEAWDQRHDGTVA